MKSSSFPFLVIVVFILFSPISRSETQECKDKLPKCFIFSIRACDVDAWVKVNCKKRCGLCEETEQTSADSPTEEFSLGIENTSVYTWTEDSNSEETKTNVETSSEKAEKTTIKTISLEVSKPTIETNSSVVDNPSIETISEIPTPSVENISSVVSKPSIGGNVSSKVDKLSVETNSSVVDKLTIVSKTYKETSSVETAQNATDEDCKDIRTDCSYHIARGRCGENWLRKECKKSCGYCTARDCKYPHFSCGDNSHVCLPPEKVCDGNPDCINGSDESKTCQNNTCSQWGVCSQLCMSTPSGHGCYCRQGYTLEKDGYTCKDNNYDNVTLYIIYTSRHEIRLVDVEKKTSVSIASGLRNTIGMDYHYEKKLIFWTDVMDDKLYSGKLNQNKLTNIVPIVSVGLATTEGLAVDWIGEKLYWAESHLEQIEVANLNGSDRRTLVAGNMTNPRSIVVDPRFGYLFWTDWGRNAKIERCSMSGKHRRRLFDSGLKYISGGWLNGITLDFEAERLYWVDAKSDSIHSVTYDGEEHHIILKDHSRLAHPFAITMFESYIYWTDWMTNSIIKANKFNGSDLKVVQRIPMSPFDLDIYHPKRQPKAFNPCAENNGGCSHLCLIGLRDKTTKKTTADCQCPNKMKLKNDHKNCQADKKFLIFAYRHQIRGVDLNNVNYHVISPITEQRTGHLISTTAVDYDSHEERLYWTDVELNAISSGHLDGTDSLVIIDSEISRPHGFAIDYLSRNMYFSSYYEERNYSTISVAKLNGAFRTEIVSQNITHLNSLALHPKLGVMFWSDIGGSKHRIIKANMDGTNKTVLVPDASSPASLIVDTKSDSLYYISKDHQTINQCFMNATCHQLNVHINNPPFTSIAIYNDDLYVSNANSIIKIKNRNQVEVLLSRTPGVGAMKVYDNERGVDDENQCSRNNGGCSQLCLPVPNGRICKCTTGITIDEDGTRCIGIPSIMLYAVGSQIHGFTLENTDEAALASISKISLASAIDFHAGDDYIYWVDGNSKTVSRIKRDLTNREEVISEGLNELDDIAVDWISNNIYWTERNHNWIKVSEANGDNDYIILHEGLVKPSSIIVHPVIGKLFFVNTNGTRKIMSAGLDGSNMKTVVGDENVDPTSLSIDYVENHLYWCDQISNTINRLDLTSGQRKIIIQNLTNCVSTTVYRDYIYWAERADGHGSIKKAKKTDGSAVDIVIDNITGQLNDITIFDQFKQRGTNICEKNKFGCSELCLYSGEKDKATCACSYGKLKEDGKTCEDYSDFLVFSEGTAIFSAHLMKESDPNPPFRLISDAKTMKNVVGIAYDYKKKRLFYSDVRRGDIQSIFFNGTDHKTVKTGLGSVEGLVFDSANEDLYYTSSNNPSINRLRLSDPLNVKQEKLIQMSEKDRPRAIVVHTCKRLVFWTNWNNENPMIQRLYLNGSQPEAIITEQIQRPNGLTIDHKADKLYWSDSRLDKIERCNIDGSNRKVIVTSVPKHPFGLAVYGDYVYWTDWIHRAVLRANKFDGSEITWLKKNIKYSPMGIVAVAEEADNCRLNQCYENRYGCEGSCITDEKGLPICQCPDGHLLTHDKKRCAPEEKCPKDHFRCTSGSCIPPAWRCDKEFDCSDFSDEKNCTYSCKKEEFQCKDSTCLPKSWECDNHPDCHDKSDEHDQCST